MTDPMLVPDEEMVLEALPDDVVATIQVRDAWFARLPKASSGLEFVVADLQRWRAGTTVRVASHSGDVDLHREIEEATHEITEACNLDLN